MFLLKLKNSSNFIGRIATKFDAHTRLSLTALRRKKTQVRCLLLFSSDYIMFFSSN